MAIMSATPTTRFQRNAPQDLTMTSDPHPRDRHVAPDNEGPPRSPWCSRVSLLIALVWMVVTAVHGYTTWPHIPMDISASDPETRAVFDAVLLRHVLIHAVVGLSPLLGAAALASLVYGKRK